MLYFINILLGIINLCVWGAILIIILINLPANLSKLKDKQTQFRFNFWNIHWFFLIFSTLLFFNPLIMFSKIIKTFELSLLIVISYNLALLILSIKFFKNLKKGG